MPFSTRRLSYTTTSTSTRRTIYIAIATILITFFLLLSYHYLPDEVRRYPQAVFYSIDEKPGIPNIVHYVWFLKDTTELHLSFETFLSIYSAQLYFKPDVIYIHTDAAADQIAHAKENGDQWTRIILRLPTVITMHKEMPVKTNTGKEIKLMEHRSDFARTEILYEMGGVYMDADVYALRDIKPLRESGFANVVGQEYEGSVNNGMVMHKAGSTLLSIFRDAQHEAFDGGWETHSADLLTTLSNRLVPVPYEVLILQQNAFAPGGSLQDQMAALFKPHSDTEPLRASDKSDLWPVLTTLEDVMKWWNTSTQDDSWWSATVKKADWEIDYSSSYTIHAFHNEPVDGWDNEITMAYMQARQCNFARAIYPAIWHAINEGIISEEAV